MKLLEFFKKYPTEQKCREKFKEYRLRQGIVCPRCNCKHHYWKEDKQMFQCKGCGYRQSLRANTVMHGSKLPFQYWFIVMHLLTATKNSFSALEIQRQLGHKRYQPIWEMVHKLRSVMGMRDDIYTLKESVEVDEGFFSTEIEEDEKGQPLKRGAGSQKKSKVVVMAESKTVENPMNPNKPKKVSHIKMKVVDNLRSQTIGVVASEGIDPNARIISDDTRSHSDFPSLFEEYTSHVVDPSQICKVLPWVHVAISNAKSLFRNLYHGTRKEFLQNYLNEFCYKFNRRYFGEGLFDRLVLASVSFRSDFSSRAYGR